MKELIDLDKKFFLYLNDLHTPWLDQVMFLVTQTILWVPLYLVLLYFVLKEYRNDSWAPLFGIFITILLSDQITSGLMKPLFERLRPSRDPEIESLVHTVNGYKGGLYGFASSHAANTFALALYFWMLFKKHLKWIAVLFLWASLVSYSRIYLGVHYPGDIAGGWIIGALSAFAGLSCFEFLKRFMKNKNSLSPGQ